MSALVLKDICKRFPSSQGPREILHNVSFEVHAGSVACLLGPNGSGKTTLLKTIATLLTPDEGRVLHNSTDVHRQPRDAKRLVGFASSENHSFYGRLSARTNLWFYAQLFGLSAPAWKERLAAIVQELELDSFIEHPFRELSSGQKQKLLIARALIHDPPVLLLDEPLQNLDPHASIGLRSLMREEWANRKKKIVLISTHQLEEAQKISDFWIVLSEGTVRFQGSLRKEKEADPHFSVEDFFQRLVAPAQTHAL
ncbi:MAG: ABC transporter ATP-binding protein [Elusimicrobia bacterium]|nr:ABC transporter ATP-binding protein [Elusimicrobiota bacterium]